jgi:calcineurin-like phosphoesterase family protein
VSIFFTADPHYGHANIIEYCNRPFRDSAEMNAAMIAHWNAAVQPDDVVYILGDLFFCSEGQAQAILRSLQGVKRLLLGNHDKLIRKSAALQKMFDRIHPAQSEAGEYSIWNETIDGTYVSMCHFPLLTWHHAGRGAYMLHGHCHNTVPFDGVSRRLDVGVDAHGYAPIRWQDIRRKLEAVPLRPEEPREASTAHALKGGA